MATKLETLEKKLERQEKQLERYKGVKGKESIAEKFEKIIKDLKEDIKKEKASSKEKSKPAKRKPISGTMTEEECNKLLEAMKSRYFASQSNTKKNIKSGRADKSGTLKAAASLENEAESIEKKEDKGQTISKTEQKKITINIDKIVRSCVEMVKKEKDSEQMGRNLIDKLQAVLSDIKSGKLKYEE